ncbi:MAG: flagellar biosynthesis protein FlhF [Spirochaetales bacterium]|nr:flagellar biosynthesis protein FlhF [Spirochaetales bacterium]
MQYFTEQGLSHRDVVDKIRDKYGDRAKILTHRSIRIGGFLGLFKKEGVEITGYLSQEGARKTDPSFEAEKKKIIEGMKQDTTLQKVLEEIQEIKKKMEPSTAAQEDHPAILRIIRLLEDNDFSASFIHSITEGLKSEMSLEELKDPHLVEQRVLEKIGGRITLHREDFSRRPKVIILVGPTGVGKTTTVAKLAAIHGLGTNGEKPKSVRIITIDNYRIAARKQIETYGDIMNIPVFSVETVEDFQKKLAISQEADIILVDTVGRSPRDYINLASMRKLLDACGTTSEVYLTVSATTKASDIKEIMQQFEPFKYVSTILTKLDETYKIGSALSALSEEAKSVAYITDGQGVPQDIEKASVTRLLKHLSGFTVQADYPEQIPVQAEGRHQ